MANPRIDDLRRRVDHDPASIAFAQLAEEYRRAGDYHEAVAVARTGLDVHPGYVSARVTLGRALLELGEILDAQREFETVLQSAPDNLAAIRALADIHDRYGRMPDATAPAAAEAPNLYAEPPGAAPTEPAANPPAEDPATVSQPAVATLERLLTAIHVTRAERRP